MCVDDDAVGDDEASRQLSRITHRLADDMSFQCRRRTCSQNARIVGRLPPVPAREAVRLVRVARGIGEREERDGTSFEELDQVRGLTLPDDGHGDSAGNELVVMIAQLRDMPAAEWSAVMA